MDNLDNIISRIESASSWQDLEKRFINAESGILTPHEAQSKYYKLEFSQRIGAIYALSKPEKALEPLDVGLEGILVKKQNVNYVVHGILHDMSNIKKVQKALLSKSNVVCETALKGNYELKNATGQRRIDEIKFCRYKDWHKAYFLEFLKEDCSSIKTSNVDEKALNKRKIGAFNLDMRRQNFPLHLKEQLPKYKLENLYSGLCFLRSLSQAQFLKSFAQKNNVSEVHGIYGWYHQHDVAEFLSNDSLRESLIDRFNSRVRKNKLKHYGSALVSLAGTVLPMVLAQSYGGAAYFSLVLCPPSLLKFTFSINNLLSK